MSNSTDGKSGRENLPVLIVEDDAPLRGFLEFSFVAKQISCITAGTVDEACSLLKGTKIALLLLDWGLDKSAVPVLQLCRTLNPLMPVIVMSGGTLDVRKDPILAEADSLLQKPFHPAVLTSQIESCLNDYALLQCVQ